MAVYVPSAYFGGAENYALTIASRMAGEGAEVILRVSSAERFDQCAEKAEQAGVVVKRGMPVCGAVGPRAKLKQGLALLWSFWHMLLDRPSVLLVGLPSPWAGFGTLLAAHILRVPCVAVFQLVAKHHALKPFHRLAMARMHASGHEWVAVSKDNRRLLSEGTGVPEEQIHLIYNGVPAVELKPGGNVERGKSPAAEELRSDLGIGKATPVLLSVGALVMQKGYPVLLEAYAALAAEGLPDCVHLIVGRGDQRESLENFVKEHGLEKVIRFLGWRDDVPDLLDLADVFVFPTRFEGFPFALLEAMAAGCPVLASDASSIPEVVEDGVTGLLFRDGDSESLAQRLRRVLRDREELPGIARAGRSVVNRFSLDDMYTNTLEVLKVAGRRARGDASRQDARGGIALRPKAWVVTGRPIRGDGFDGSSARASVLLEVIQEYFDVVEIVINPNAGGRPWLENEGRVVRPVAPEASLWRLAATKLTRRLGVLANDSMLRFCWRDCTTIGRAVMRRWMWEDNPAFVLVEYITALEPASELAHHKGVPIVLDMHDLLSQRTAMAKKEKGTVLLEIAEEEEVRAMSKANLILAIQEDEARFVRERARGAEVLTVPHSFGRPVFELGDGEEGAVLFVGSGAAHNLDALNGFLSDHWDTVRAGCPEAKLDVCGRICDHIEGALPEEVRLHGVVRDLQRNFSNARVVLNIPRYGSGLKIKAVEALRHGRVVLSTHVGAQGFGDNSRCMEVVEWSGVGNALVKLLSDGDQRIALREAARATYESTFSPLACHRALREWLSGVAAQGELHRMAS